MKRAIAALSILAAFTAGAAWAQPSDAPPASAVQAQEARAEADRLIAQAEAADLFDNITEDDQPRIRHRRSGLICTFTLGERQNRLLVFGSGIARGDDVGCNTMTGDVAITHYATRYPGGKSAADALSEAAAAIRNRFSDARDYTGEGLAPDEGRQPPSLIARFLIGQDDETQYTHALVAEVGPWVFKQRLSGPAESASMVQLFGQAQWVYILREADRRLNGV